MPCRLWDELAQIEGYGETRRIFPLGFPGISGDFRLVAAVAASLCSPTEQERGRYGESAWKHQPSKYGGCRRPSAPVKRRFTPSTTFPSRSARTSSSRCWAPLAAAIGRAHV